MALCSEERCSRTPSSLAKSIPPPLTTVSSSSTPTSRSAAKASPHGSALPPSPTPISSSEADKCCMMCCCDLPALYLLPAAQTNSPNPHPIILLPINASVPLHARAATAGFADPPMSPPVPAHTSNSVDCAIATGANTVAANGHRPRFRLSDGCTSIPYCSTRLRPSGCLQSIYGIYTFRIESIARGKASPVDELQFQGVSNPGLLRKVIIVEAAKSIREFSSWKSTPTQTRSLNEVSAFTRLQSPGTKPASSSRSAAEAGGELASDFLLHKIEEVKESVKKVESLLGQLKLVTEDT